MSEGPIKMARAAWAPKRDEVPRAEQVHGIRDGRAYCGRRVTKRSAVWSAVTCPDCWAMRRADEEAGETGGTAA